MKNIRSLITGLVVCGVALAMAVNLSAQTVQQGIVKIVNIKGSARYMASGGTAWQPLKVGMILKAGTVVQTAGDNSYVDAVLNNADAFESPPTTDIAGPVSTGGGGSSGLKPKAEQDAIRIYENSVLAVEKLTVTQTGADTVTETLFDLKHGRLFGTVKKLTGASTYQVKIPNGVAGIRGTIYFISADGILSVLSGSVVLAYIGSDGNPVTQVVTAGQQFDSRTGKLSNIPQQEKDKLHMAALAFGRHPQLPAVHRTPGTPVVPMSPHKPGN